jgi:hypothetical protein
VIAAFLDLPLRALGAADAQWVLVQGNDQPVVIRGTPYTELRTDRSIA